MATYKCLECGHIFDEGKERRWIEPHGEHMTGCPVCGCAYDEAYQCDECALYRLPDELHSGLCIECVGLFATPQNIADWVDTDPLIAEDYYSYYYDSAITDSSPQLRQLLRGGVLQRVALEKLNGITETQKKCKRFVTDNEENTDDFARWLTKKGKKQ